jgi:GNAT superfamily N-acetyltransferase
MILPIDARVRPVSPEEASELSRIAFDSKAYWGYSDEFMNACRDELTYDKLMIESSRFEFRACEVDGRLLGFYALDHRGDGHFELEALFVRPDCIGKGVGRHLIEHAKDLARSMGGLRLLIQGDPHAEAFYVAAGGTKVGERESGSVPGRVLPEFQIRLDEG